MLMCLFVCVRVCVCMCACARMPVCKPAKPSQHQVNGRFCHGICPKALLACQHMPLLYDLSNKVSLLRALFFTVPKYHSTCCAFAIQGCWGNCRAHLEDSERQKGWFKPTVVSVAMFWRGSMTIIIERLLKPTVVSVAMFWRGSINDSYHWMQS